MYNIYRRFLTRVKLFRVLSEKLSKMNVLFKFSQRDICICFEDSFPQKMREREWKFGLPTNLAWVLSETRYQLTFNMLSFNVTP